MKRSYLGMKAAVLRSLSKRIDDLSDSSKGYDKAVDLRFQAWLSLCPGSTDDEITDEDRRLNKKLNGHWLKLSPILRKAILSK